MEGIISHLGVEILQVKSQQKLLENRIGWWPWNFNLSKTLK